MQGNEVERSERIEQEAAKQEALPGIRVMQDVEPEEVNWVWYPYLPAGKLIMLEGDPGLGKSWISCDISSRVSTGAPFPGQTQSRPPGRALILSAEDGLGETIRPRLEKLGANMHNVFASDEHFTLDDRGISALEYTMSKVEATIVFLDPIVGYMGTQIDMHRANEVRGLMAKLHQIAKRTGSAVIAVRHLRKGGGGKAIYNGIGSIDFTAAARSALQVGMTKGGKTYMAHIKHNLSPEGPTLAYEIEDNVFKWKGELEFIPEEKPKTSTKARAGLEQFLFDLLKDGPQPASRVLELAHAHGWSTGTVQKIKTGLVHSRKQGKEWLWELQGREGMGDLLVPNEQARDPILEEAIRRMSSNG